MKSHKIKKILKKYGIKLNFKQEFIDIIGITEESGVVTIDFANILKNSFPLKKKDKAPIIGTDKKFAYTFSHNNGNTITSNIMENGYFRTYGFQASVVLNGAKKIKSYIEKEE